MWLLHQRVMVNRGLLLSYVVQGPSAVTNTPMKHQDSLVDKASKGKEVHCAVDGSEHLLAELPKPCEAMIVETNWSHGVVLVCILVQLQ